MKKYFFLAVAILSFAGVNASSTNEEKKTESNTNCETLVISDASSEDVRTITVYRVVDLGGGRASTSPKTGQFDDSEMTLKVDGKLGPVFKNRRGGVYSSYEYYASIPESRSRNVDYYF